MSLQAGCPRIWRMRPRLRLAATLYPQAERVSAARSASPSGGPDRTGRVSARRSQRLQSDYTPISAKRLANHSTNQDAPRTHTNRINPQTVRTHADTSDKNKGNTASWPSAAESAEQPQASRHQERSADIRQRQRTRALGRLARQTRPR